MLELRNGYKLTNVKTKEVRYVTEETYQNTKCSYYCDDTKEWVVVWDYENCYYLYDELSGNSFLMNEVYFH